MLRDNAWNDEYRSDDGDLSKRFYIPILSNAVEYKRGTGYFNANALVRNVRGLKGLINNKGKMKLLVGCTLESAEIDAIKRGEEWKKQVEQKLSKISLDTDNIFIKEGLELLAWMIAYGYLEIKISIRCDENNNPIENSIYHRKIGIVCDVTGDRIAWSGSDNETPSGQIRNSESFDVYTSWELPKRVNDKEKSFDDDWAGCSGRTIVMNVPEAIRQKILKYVPPNGNRPIILTRSDSNVKQYDDVWKFINQAHKAKNGDMVGLTTAPVEPWPHQTQVLRRLQSKKHARLLISDEVGLGKTIQAGLFMRQKWLEGKSKILVMAPFSLLTQWQIELREKLNLDWPIYDGSKLTWQDTHAHPNKREKQVGGPVGHGPIIMSSQLARRSERMRDIINTNWDVVILDEAHHARRKQIDPKKHTPNQILQLMDNIKHKTNDLILLTATPMQIHPVELYDLLDLLGMPHEWNWSNFERFTNCLNNHKFEENLEFLRILFSASEKMYGKIDESKLKSNMQTKKIMRILHGENARLQDSDYKILEDVLRLSSPVSQLMSRNTRRHLREYIKNNKLNWNLGKRVVCDKFEDMSSEERKIYDVVFEYVQKIWNSHNTTNRNAIGFLCTIYLTRLTSSFAALDVTLHKHYERISKKGNLKLNLDELKDADEDLFDVAEEISESMQCDINEVKKIQSMIKNLPIDTKFTRLLKEIHDLQSNGYGQIMIFTQYTDTMDFLRDELNKTLSVMCYSGRHGEVIDSVGNWKRLSRADTKKKFAKGDVDLLLCTQAAAEGLNFQFCGALINYDMPWNPMKVEQRIGRIDRIGQKHNQMNIINMYYNGTIEEKRYRVLRDRYDLFEETVGTLPSILSDGETIENVLEKNETNKEFHNLSQDDTRLNLDDILAADTAMYVPPKSPVTLKDLNRIMANNDIMSELYPRPTSSQLYEVTSDGKKYRITTDRDQFYKHSDSLEFWSLGSPIFPNIKSNKSLKYDTLEHLLDSLEMSCD